MKHKVIVSPFCIDKILIGAKTSVMVDKELASGSIIELHYYPHDSNTSVPFATAKVIALIGLRFQPSKELVFRRGPFSWVKCQSEIVRSILKCDGHDNMVEFWRSKLQSYETNQIYFEDLKQIA